MYNKSLLLATIIVLLTGCDTLSKLPTSAGITDAEASDSQKNATGENPDIDAVPDAVDAFLRSGAVLRI